MALIPQCEVCANEKALFLDQIEPHLSIARCTECRDGRRLPWDVLVGMLLNGGYSYASAIQDMLIATCKFYGRPQSELWADVEANQLQYQEEQAHA